MRQQQIIRFGARLRVALIQHVKLFGGGGFRVDCRQTRSPAQLVGAESDAIGVFDVREAGHHHRRAAGQRRDARHYARLIADKTDRLREGYDIRRAQPDVAELLQRPAANQRGLAGELAGILGDLGKADIAFPGGVRAVQRGEAGGVVATKRLHARHLSDGQRGAEAIVR